MSRAKNSRFSFVVLLVLGISQIIASIVTIIMDVDIDLSKEVSITGIVDKKGYEYIHEGRHYERYMTFKIKKLDELFAVNPKAYRIFNVESSLNIGDTLKVFYRPSSRTNTKVFQIEKNKVVIADYDSYNQESSYKAFFLFLLGSITLVYLLFTYKKWSLVTILNSLVK